MNIYMCIYTCVMCICLCVWCVCVCMCVCGRAYVSTILVIKLGILLMQICHEPRQKRLFTQQVKV